MVPEAFIARRIISRTFSLQRCVRHRSCCYSSQRALDLLRDASCGATTPTNEAMVWSDCKRHASSSGWRTTMPLLRSYRSYVGGRCFGSSSSTGEFGGTNGVDNGTTTVNPFVGSSHAVRDHDKNLSSGSSFKVSRVSYDGTMYVVYLTPC